MPVYDKCDMTKIQHVAAYLASSMILTGIVWLFYHSLLPAMLVGCLGGVIVERMYAQHTVEKRKKELLLQFKEFLESMSVAAGAGNVEIQAVRSALKDLKIAYSESADIVKEIEHILLQYEKGGMKLKDLFQELADRSGLEDIQSFAAIYTVIEGKSDRFGEILLRTQSIIGDKIEIEQEIETVITSAKSETNMMVVMPIIIVVAMSKMGNGLLDALFTTWAGHVAATISLLIFIGSYIYARKVSDIKFM